MNEEIRHVIVSRARFKDMELLDKYLAVSKEYFVEGIRSQIEKNFKVCIMVTPQTEEYIREELAIDFDAVYDMPGFIDYVNNGRFNIQTRHDIDDWMSPHYVEQIHSLYRNHIDKHDKFLIQAQPIKLDIRDGRVESAIGRYHDKRTSMFLSLCQHDNKHHIFEKKHGWMWQVAGDVYSVREGCVKWVIHGDNISCNRAKNFKFSDTEER